MHIPTTSTTLLREIAQDSQHARWSEFVARYRPMMEAFLRERFPMIDADDVIQETLVALCAALPSYHYVPDEKGHFHNYLTGILRNKALRHLHREKRQTEIADAVGVRVPSDRDGRAVAPRPPSGMMADDESSWREARDRASAAPGQRVHQAADPAGVSACGGERREAGRGGGGVWHEAQRG